MLQRFKGGLKTEMKDSEPHQRRLAWTSCSGFPDDQLCVAVRRPRINPASAPAVKALKTLRKVCWHLDSARTVSAHNNEPVALHGQSAEER